MNINESDFEIQLRALRPAAPSPALRESIARELAPSRAIATIENSARIVPRRDWKSDAPGFFDRIFPGLRWAFAGAAVAIAIVGVALHFDRMAPSEKSSLATIAAPDFEPVEVTRDLVAAEDGGVVYQDEQEPARLVRYSSLEHHVWTHPITGARLEVEVPREDVVLVPLAMQ